MENINQQNQNENSNEAKQNFLIQKIYLKNSNFEIPNAPEVFKQNLQPEVKMEFKIASAKLADQDVYEVLLILNITMQQQGATVYQIKATQAGIFTLVGFKDEELKQLLNTYCPNIIYPFARESVCEMAVRGGFPQLLITPINFDALYAEQLKKATAKSEQEVAVH